MELKSYKVSIDGDQWHTINSTSPGKAKSSFLRSYDANIEYTWLKYRANGNVANTDGFEQMAKYRGIEFAYCGMVVEVNGSKGWIVGSNSSANLDVLFFEGKYKGEILNCHPNWKVKYFNRRGELIFPIAPNCF
jgi:hypothetical protein